MSSFFCPGVILAFKWYTHYFFPLLLTPLEQRSVVWSRAAAGASKSWRGAAGGRAGPPWGWAGACPGARAMGSPHNRAPAAPTSPLLPPMLLIFLFRRCLAHSRPFLPAGQEEVIFWLTAACMLGVQQQD